MYKIIVTLIIYCVNFSLYSQIGIGAVNPHSSAILEIESITKGFLPPRLASQGLSQIASLFSLVAKQM